MKWLLGIDIGGTTVKIAVLDMNGIISDKWEVKTDIRENGVHIPKDIATSFETYLETSGKKKEDFAGAGIGAPGFINFSEGVVEYSPNIGWKDFALVSEFEQAVGLPAVLENDANAAALGEMWKGAGEGASELLAITLGTGVGGGVITNGNIVHGTAGMAGEIGHITVERDENKAVKCGCGRLGCIETIASATGISRLALQKRKNQDTTLNELKDVTARDVFEAYKAGDSIAAEVIDEMTEYLGLTISNIANTLNPKMIVIGGGVSKAGHALLEPLDAQFKRFALERVYESTSFKIAELENDAGVIGCAWLARKHFLPTRV
ncbi:MULTISPECIES: ROK family glucokinase [unclassified Exiguobacterium]|uniref:ROK family glucokinase n=1 Tax=unclassified Exiguobacterium TaxID=2644629 RepID=UPI001BE7BFF1|nr:MULTISPECIES: ROK family glucokinase [unclassified Exiguobacterium]